MLIIALVLAVVGLAALVTAVVTSNELIAWVCIAASVVGVVLLIVDAIRERSQANERGSVDAAPSDNTAPTDDTTAAAASAEPVEDYPDDAPIVDEFDENRQTPAGLVEEADENAAEPAPDTAASAAEPDDAPIVDEFDENRQTAAAAGAHDDEDAAEATAVVAERTDEDR